MQELISQKLAAFDALQDDFVTAFQFVQGMHGQQRLQTVPVGDAVRYLHALWLCECKDRLLSVPKTIRRYEGVQCLNLLADWQAGDTTGVIAFMQNKLDMQPFAEFTRQLQAAWQQGNIPLAQRLEHGRRVLLDRGYNLHAALDGIFALRQPDLMTAVQQACAQIGHTAAQIERQLSDMTTPPYAFTPHRMLAQRNMQIMNTVGVNALDRPQDEPGRRTWRVENPTMPGPFASTPIYGYREMTSPRYNNPRHTRFVDRPDTPDAGMIVGEVPAPPQQP